MPGFVKSHSVWGLLSTRKGRSYRARSSVHVRDLVHTANRAKSSALASMSALWQKADVSLAGVYSSASGSVTVTMAVFGRAEFQTSRFVSWILRIFFGL